MSRLLDTTICPDCRGPLDPDATCTVCGLRISGPLARQLWNAMVAADRLIEQLRRESAPAPGGAAAGAVPGTGTGTAGGAAALPTYPVPAPGSATPPRRRLLPAASVPVVLLSLGALCLLVAAIVFVAVAWGLLGLTGRTLVLLGFTGVLALVAVTLTRKGLRVAAETLWLVVAGMLTVDLLAAHSAGLLGLDGLSWRGTGALVGVPLLALFTGVGAWARRLPLGRLYGAETVAVLGGVVLCSTNVWGARNPAIATTIAVPVLVAAVPLLRRAVPVTAYGLGGLGGITWLVLLGVGWDRALELAGPAQWWQDLRGWPLLVASAYAAAAVHLRGVDARLRAGLAAAGLFPLVLLANGPQTQGLPTRDLLVACATLVVLGAIAALAPRVWARGAAGLTVVGIALLGLWLLVAPWDVLVHLTPDGRTGAGKLLVAPQDNAASWAFLVAALALVLAAVGLLRQLPAAAGPAATRVLGTLAPGALALGTLVMVLELEPPLWAGVLAAALATAFAGAAAWSAREHLLAAVLGCVATTYLTAVTLYAASATHLLLALATSALAVALGVVAALRERTGAQPSAAALAGLSALAGGWALAGWGAHLGALGPDIALALAGYAGMVGVLARPLARTTATRVALESSAVALALLATAGAGDDRTTAMVLTLVGTALCVVAVTTRDRDLAGWAGAVVLGGATVIRVATDVRAPELYTLPAAVLLLAAGLWRLHTDPETGSVRMLGSGVTLALLPSLLLALDEPVSLRGALVGAAAVLVLAAGLQQRLAAPFVLGALSTGVLAVRHLQPVAEAVPRWVSLGGVGVVLLLVGITWEARRRNLETAHRYLTDLR